MGTLNPSHSLTHSLTHLSTVDHIDCSYCFNSSLGVWKGIWPVYNLDPR